MVHILSVNRIDLENSETSYKYYQFCEEKMASCLPLQNSYKCTYMERVVGKFLKSRWLVFSLEVGWPSLERVMCLFIERLVGLRGWLAFRKDGLPIRCLSSHHSGLVNDHKTGLTQTSGVEHSFNQEMSPDIMRF